MELNDFWYPVCLASALKGRPVAAGLLGAPLVLFRGQDGAPAALVDKCPHRRARLSAGNLRDGTVECVYHGWRFAPSGDCVRVPGHLDQERACARSGAIAHAAREVDGMIFVYGRPGEPRGEPYRHPKTAAPGWGWFVREFRCKGTLELALDNFMDVMHPPFLHPGMLYDDDTRQQVEVTVRKWVAPDQPGHAGVEAVYTGEPSPTRGLVARVLLAGKSYDETYHVERFIAPGTHQNKYAVSDRAQMFVTSYNTPEDHENLRIFMLCVYRFPWPRALSRLLIDRFLVGPTVREDVDFFNAQWRDLLQERPDLPERSTILDTHGLRVRAFMKRLQSVDSLDAIEIPETRFSGLM